MTCRNNRQNEIYDRFKRHSGLSSDHVDLFRDCIVATEHENQWSGSDDSDIDDEDELDLGVKRYKADGSEFTLADVPLRSLVEAIEAHIKMYVGEHRRTEVYKLVVEGVHGIKQTPQWDRVDNPRAKPQTPFSESRAPPKFRQPNHLLFETFQAVAKVSPETLARIRGMIVWRDSQRSNGTWGAINWDTFKVTGGRLGPTEEHTLADVPNCYVRDCLMASTFTCIDKEKRDLVREEVFSDLTLSQIKEYAEIIEGMEHEAQTHGSAKAKKRPKPSKAVDRARSVREIQYRRKISPQEAECIMKQEELLDVIDSTINLAPDPSFAARRMKRPQPHQTLFSSRPRYSVLKPGALIEEGDEVSVPSDSDIDRDCDQVRAMIKILVREGHWTMEQFTRALEGPRRQQISNFLEKRGPLQGKQSQVFPLSWDFFKRRELLGLELTAPPPKPKLGREVQALRGVQSAGRHRGTKRPSLDDLRRPGHSSKKSKY
ncbi:hypothetical protein F5Y14DRAFT_405318 [Nemania sp. NC0429]|nr:hypothetical protein F5Y14DRAFT_405318 [Nemania sp. NC0429]